MKLPDEAALYQAAKAIDREWDKQLGGYSRTDFIQSAGKLLVKHGIPKFSITREVERPGPLLGDPGNVLSLMTLSDILDELKNKGLTAIRDAKTLIEAERANHAAQRALRNEWQSDPASEQQNRR